MSRQITKICPSCQVLFRARRDAKTCSERCRKRMQRVKVSIVGDIESVKQSAQNALKGIEQIIASELSPKNATEAGFVGDGATTAQVATQPTQSVPAAQPQISNFQSSQSTPDENNQQTVQFSTQQNQPQPYAQASNAQSVAPTIQTVTNPELAQELPMAAIPPQIESLDSVPVSPTIGSTASSQPTIQSAPAQLSSSSVSPNTAQVANNVDSSSLNAAPLPQPMPFFGGNHIIANQDQPQSAELSEQAQNRSENKSNSLRLPKLKTLAKYSVAFVMLIALPVFLFQHQRSANLAKQSETTKTTQTQTVSATDLATESSAQTLHFNRDTTIDNGSDLTATGQVTIKNQTNSSNALSVQNSSGTSLINVDTNNSTVTITGLQGSGGSLTALNASNISSGTLSDARLSSGVTLLGNSFNGANQLLKTNAAGTIETSNLPSGIAYVDATQTFSGANTFSNSANSFSGNGANITSLNASNVGAGTLSDSRLSTNVALLNGTGPQTFSGNNLFGGAVSVKNTSSTAFQIQNSGGSSNLLIADTTSSRIAINQASASYALDVNGSINVTSGNTFKIAGADICTSSGCTAASGSNDYVQNGTTIQSANFAIQSSGAGSVGGLIKGATSQTADLLQINDSSNNKMFSVASDGSVLIQTPGSDSTTAFQVLNHNATSHLIVADTQNAKVAIGLPSPSYLLDVGGDINTTTGIRIGGNYVCTSSGCTPGGGSGSYIQNGTSLQSGNFAIQSSNNTDIVAKIRGASGQSADMLQIISGDGGSTLLSVGATGDSTFRSATGFNSTTAFQVQKADSTSIFKVDTQNGRVGVNLGSTGTLAHNLDIYGNSFTSSTSEILSVHDTTAMGLGVGGGIGLFGNYGPDETIGAGIKASKTNGTSGDYGFDLSLYARQNGQGNLTEGLRIQGSDNSVLLPGSSIKAPDALSISNSNSGAITVAINGSLNLNGTSSGGVASAQPIILFKDNSNQRWSMGLDVAESPQNNDFFIGRVDTNGVTTTDVIYLKDRGTDGAHKVNIGLGYVPPNATSSVSLSNLTSDDSWDSLNIRGNQGEALGSTLGKALRITDGNNNTYFVVNGAYTGAGSQNATPGFIGIGSTNPQQALVIGTSSVQNNQTFAIEMAPPGAPSVSAASGGSLASATYYFKTVAVDGAGGTTAASSESTCTTSSPTTTRCSLSWSTVTGAVSYRIYKGTSSGAEDRYQTTSSTSYNYDSDSGATVATPPSVTTAYNIRLTPGANSYIAGSGNLGIDTANPTHKLEVGGTIPDFRVGNGSGGLTIQSNGSNITMNTDGAQEISSNTSALTATSAALSVASGLVKSDSNTAFQIQNSGATSNLFVADTNNSRLGIGVAPTLGSKLKISTTTDSEYGILAISSGSNGSAGVFQASGTSGNKYGFQATASGAGGQNVGGWFSASGATANYAIQISTNPSSGANNWALYSSSSAQSYFAGNVGIGVSVPTAALSLGSDAGVSGGIKFGSAGDVNLFRVNSGRLKTDTNLEVGQDARVTGDIFAGYGLSSQIRLALSGTKIVVGSMSDGATTEAVLGNSVGTGGTPGVSFGVTGSSQDTTLYRSATNKLRTTGTIIAATAIQAPAIDVESAGTLSIGTSTATGVTIGSTSQTGTITIGQSTDSNTISIGNGDTANGKTQTIGIGSTSHPVGTGKVSINIGSNNGSNNLVNIEGGTGSTAIQIGNSGTNHGIQIGTGAAVQTVTIGSTDSTSTTTLQGGTGVTVKATSTTAFVIQKADASGTIFTADTSTGAITVSGTLTASSGVTISGGSLVTSSTGIFVTSLPVSPVDGQEVYYKADATNGIIWHLRYNSSEATYKWEFIGGSPLLNEDTAGGTTTSTSYADVGTPPQATAPNTGQYRITFYSEVGPNAANQAVQQYQVRIAPKLGSATAVDADSTMLQDETATETRGGVSRTILRTLTANDVVKLQARVNAGTGSIQRSGIEITPVRIN